MARLFLTAERRRELSRVPAEARLERAAALLAEGELALAASEDELGAALRLEYQLESSDTRKEDARSRVASALLGVGQVARTLNDAALLMHTPMAERRSIKKCLAQARAVKPAPMQRSSTSQIYGKSVHA